MNFSEPVYILLHLASFSFVISLAFAGFMISAGLVDNPVDRSNHSETVPTAGGIGIVAGAGAGLLALAMFYPNFANHSLLGAMSAAALGIAFLGLMDDIYDISAVLKFIVIITLGVVAVTVMGPPGGIPVATVDIRLPYWLAFAGAVLWVFVVANGVNFMDGANGLMSGFMLIALSTLSLFSYFLGAETSAVFAAILAAGIAGFLPYNGRTRAYIFSGDVGALFVGFGFAVCTLVLISETGSTGLVYLGPILILPFLTDILMTMLFRAIRKENLLTAHSSHLYQHLIRAGYSHRNVALIYAGTAILSGATALIGMQTGLIRSLFYLILLVLIWVGIYLVLIRKYPNLSDQPQTPPDP